MSRRRKTPFRLFESKKEKDKHVRLAKSMLLDKKFIELSKSAKILYIYMKLWAGGQEEFQYAKSLATSLGIISGGTFVKAVRELIQKGFIVKKHITTGGAHIPNTYEFSANWLDISYV